MNKLKLISSFICFLFIITGVSAGVFYSGDTLGSAYGSGDLIKGMLNLTFNETDIDAIVSTNFGNSISLRDLLGAQGLTSGNYNCSNPNCLNDYQRKNQVTSLVPAKSIVGLSLEGNNVRNIGQIRVTTQGSGGPSCIALLKLDLLGKNENIITSSRYLDDTSCYGPRYGCFEFNAAYQGVTIPSNGEYCEKIHLPGSPAFKLGANVTNSTQGSSVLEMRLYTSGGSYLKKCTLPEFTSQNQILTCTVEYSASIEKDYLVCIKATSSSGYKIRAETNQPCGSDNLGSTFTSDYEIFAQNLKFDTPFIDLTKEYFLNTTGINIDNYVSEYISEVYNKECEPYCVVPLRFFGVNQGSFSNVHIQYDRDGAQGVESSFIYELEKKNATIVSPPLMLNIGLANFTIPQNASGNYLDIFIGEELVLHKPINLSAGFDFNVQPEFAAYGVDTIYSVTSGFNITQAKWTFGDGSVGQTGIITGHRYLQEGQATISVEATRSDGAVSKRYFTITIGDPKTSANATIVQYQNNLKEIGANISTYPLWIQTSIKTGLDYDGLNKLVGDLSYEYSRAQNVSDFVRIMNKLIALKVPNRIYTGTGGNLPLVIGANNFDVGALEEISSGDVDDEALRQGIVSWMNSNYRPQARFEGISALYSGSAETVLTIFTLETGPVKESDGERYLVLSYPSDQVIFASNYNPESTLGAVYIPLKSGNEIFEFAITGEVSVEELGAYISPSLEFLGTFNEPSFECNYDKVCEKDAGETRANCSDCRPWGVAWFLIIIILAGGAAGFFILRRWYKTKYESSLFKNKQDLFNLMGFIGRSKQSGMNEKDIRKKLKGSGWRGEQISYAFRKLGERPEGGHNPSDTRFIKRPSLP